MSRATLFDTWCFGRELDNQTVIKACLDFAARNFEWVEEQEAFCQLSLEDESGCLQHKRMDSRGKHQFDAIKKWHRLKRDPAPMKHDFEELIQAVNWRNMTEDNLLDIMESLEDKQLK